MGANAVDFEINSSALSEQGVKLDALSLEVLQLPS
jgi:hypothetical protein